MITTLTTQTRSRLVNAIAGSGYPFSPPHYVTWGIGSGNASATDIAIFNPVGTPISGTLSTITTSTPGDTFSFSGTLTASGSYQITNVGLTDSQVVPAVGYLTSQVNPTDLTVSLSGYSLFPNTFPFLIQVYTEVMEVISGNGSNTFNVIRGANGSSILTTIIPSLTPVVGPAGNLFMKSSFQSIPLTYGDSIQFNINIQFV